MKKGPFFFFKLFLVLLFVSILCLPGMVTAMDVIRLENGLNCIFEKRKDTGVVAIQVWVKVGSKSEDVPVAGITHFIEHLIFKGTETGGRYEIAPRIEALGGSINAFTSYDNTVYHIVVPAQAFETGLELLVGAVRHPLFPEEELEKEKRVVIQEIKMGEDDPQRKLFKELFSLSYEGHPYGRPIIGYEETVGKIGRPDIVSYFRKHYTIENMVVVIVGDFDEEKAKELLRKQFSGEPARARTLIAPGGKLEEKTGRTKLVEKSVKETYLALSYAIPSIVHPDIPALDVLSRVLGDGDSSRLQSMLKHKKGIVTNAGTYLFTPQQDGQLVILATLKGKDHTGVVKAIGAEIARLLKDGVEPWELEKAKNLAEASYIYMAETVQGKARQIGYYETMTGDHLFSEKYLKSLSRITADDITRMIETYVTKKEKNLVVVLPKGSSNPHTFHLKNGLTCVLNRNQASPSFSFMIGFTGGLKEEQEGKNGSFTVLSKMLLKGTKDLDAQAIARKMDTLAGGISPVSGKNVFGLSGKFLSKDLEEALLLLREVLTQTAVREAELKKVKEEVLSEIRQREDDPVTYTFNRMNQLLFEGHPYGNDTVGNAKDVTGLTLPDVEGLYKGYVTSKGAVLAISGDIELKGTEKLLHRLFDGWGGPSHPLRTLSYDLQSRRTKKVEKEIVQTHLTFAFLGPGLIHEDRGPVEVLVAVLSGMGGRIFKRLREERPYAYATTFFNQMAYESGSMGIYIGTDRKHVPDIEQVVAREIEQIRKEGFTEEEVENGKRYLIGNHYIRMQSNTSIASSMCLDTIYGLGPDLFKVWPGRIERVTKEEVNETAKKYLLLHRMVQIEVGP